MQAHGGLFVTLLCCAAGALSACAPTRLGPYTTVDLARDGQREPAVALLHYLAQPHADPAACALPFLKHIELDGIDDLVSAGADGDMRAQVFWGCMRAALEQWDALRQRRALSRLADVYLDALQASDGSRPLRAALRELLLQAPAARTQAVVLQDMPKQLQEGLGDRDFDSVAEPLAREWLVALELDANRFQGKPLTQQSIGALNDATLQLAAARLSHPELRTQASSELLRRRAERSPFASVRDAVDATVQTVLSAGYNALDLELHPLQQLWLDPQSTPTLLLAEQDTERGTALLTAAIGKSRVAYLPLRKLLGLTAKDLEQPVKLCGSAQELDPSPCLPSALLRVDAADSSMDKDAVLHLPDALPLERLLALLTNKGYTLRMRAGQVELLREMRLAISPPEAIDFGGSFYGGNGPALFVQVREHGGFALFKVIARADPADASAQETRYALVNLSAPGEFAITSRGGKGSTGSAGTRGMDGSDGMSGSSASCGFSAGSGTSGSSGGNGGSGGMGGQGGNGGDIDLEVSCSSDVCNQLTALLHNVVRSVGGPGGDGGPGGPGGKGGRGGRGGSGTSCSVTGASGHTSTQSQSGGSDGSNGTDGSSGMPGTSGFSGSERIVTVRLRKQ